MPELEKKEQKVQYNKDPNLTVFYLINYHAQDFLPKRLRQSVYMNACVCFLSRYFYGCCHFF